MTPTERRLQEEIDRLRNRPPPVPRVEYPLVQIGDGNDLGDGIYSPAFRGLRGLWSGTGSPITTVPAAAPTASQFLSATFADGLCAGRDLSSGAYVWVASVVNPGGGNQWDHEQSFCVGEVIAIRRWVQLPISGGGGALSLVALPWLGPT